MPRSTDFTTPASTPSLLCFSRRGLTSKKHSGVIALFDRHWVNTGQVPISHGRLYRTLFENREKGDYLDLARFERAEVEKLLAGAVTFVKTVSEKARAKIADEST